MAVSHPVVKVDFHTIGGNYVLTVEHDAYGDRTPRSEANFQTVQPCKKSTSDQNYRFRIRLDFLSTK